MSDHLQHECGIAMLRLLKPLEYYKEKYGTPFYGIDKMYLMLEKQHNRGQDGAGLASVKFDMQPGERYISRIRSNANQPIQDIFNQINTRISEILKENPEIKNDTEAQKHLLPYIGNVFLGHVRYGTFGKNSIESVHPFLRQNNWIYRNLIVAGNFNMTNSKELFQKLVELGQHPKEQTDTVTIMERIGHFLDTEVENLYQKLKAESETKESRRDRRGRDRDRDKGGRKSRKNNENMVRFFFNLGKRDKLKKTDVLDIINQATKKSKKRADIGDIEVLEKFSFFEVEKSFEKDILNNIAAMKFKGKEMRAEVAN